MVGEGLSVGFVDDEQLAKWINGGKHWIVAFGRDQLYHIDSLDKHVGTEPTNPTLVTLAGAITVIPKATLSRKRLLTWVEGLGAETKGGNRATGDILFFSNDPDNVLALAREIARMAGPKP